MLSLAKLKVRDLNEHVTCSICGGYFIDATTIIECLHSFCRSCIVTHMMINRFCPKCEVPAHKTRPLLNIRSDKTLQDIVYKLVPNLLEKERNRKRRFHDETGIPEDVEEQKRGSVTLSPEKSEHRVSLSLEHDNREIQLSAGCKWQKEKLFFPKRYLRCYDAVYISTVNKLVRKKLRREDLQVLSFCRGELLPETYTLNDVTGTFSWKSDRPLSLTYMTFSSKSSKRKLPSLIEEEVEENTPPKKVLIENVSESPKQAVAPIITSPTATKQQENTMQPKPVSEPTVETSQPDSKVVASVPSVQVSPFINTSSTQQAAKPTQPVTGVKVMSYSVRNVPFVNPIPASISETETNTTLSRPFVTPERARSASQTPTQHSFAPSTAANTHAKVKRINLIANRLQMEKVKSTPNLKSDSHVTPNNSQQTALVQHLQQNQSSWAPSNVSPTMKRNMMAQRINASFSSQQRMKDESMRSYLSRQDNRPGASGSRGYASRRDSRPHGQPNQGSFGRFDVSVNSKLPNYSQATDQRNKVGLAQQRQHSAQPRFRELTQNLHGRAEQNQSIAQMQRYQNKKLTSSNAEDSQLLSTTRQLASLREQQKLLDEIAAAVAARRPNMRTTESIRAAISNFSPKSSTPRLSQTTVSSNQLKQSTSAYPVVRPVRPTSSPRNAVNITGMPNTNGGQVRSKSNGGKPFNDTARLPKDMGRPLLNKPRDGGIDIYQNTIARAKAQIREMNLKERVHQHRNQIRAAVSPYNVQSHNLTRKLSGPAPRPPPYSSFMQQRTPSPNPQRSSAMSSASINQFNRPGPTYYKGLNTKPPPPPQFQQRYTPPGVFKKTFQHRPPPPPNPLARPPTFVRQSAAPLPEQDEPLCLVVKK